MTAEEFLNDFSIHKIDIRTFQPIYMRPSDHGVLLMEEIQDLKVVKNYTLEALKSIVKYFDEDGNLRSFNR